MLSDSLCMDSVLLGAGDLLRGGGLDMFDNQMSLLSDRSSIRGHKGPLASCMNRAGAGGFSHVLSGEVESYTRRTSVNHLYVLVSANKRD